MSTVRLAALAPEEFDRFLADLTVQYAEDHVRDGHWTAEEAPASAAREIRKLLPSGLTTPDHFFYRVENEQGADVGRVWLAVRRGEGPAHAFVYDLLIFPEYRRRGYGEAAMRALEPIARAHGMSRIALHVFGHNRTAIELYERIGYAPTNLLMSKPLGGSG